MTQQFKFGDKCRHLTGGLEVVIVNEEPVITDDGSKMWEVFEETFGHHLCSDYKLEPIPHPDTVRLDWLIKNGAHIETSDGIWALYVDEDDEGVVENPSRIRAGIDSIMQRDASRTGRKASDAGNDL